MKPLQHKAIGMVPNALAFVLVIGIGLLLAGPAAAAVDMQMFLAPFTQLKTGFTVFISLAVASVIIIALFAARNNPGMCVMIIVLAIVGYILLVGALA